MSRLHNTVKSHNDKYHQNNISSQSLIVCAVFYSLTTLRSACICLKSVKKCVNFQLVVNLEVRADSRCNGLPNRTSNISTASRQPYLKHYYPIIKRLMLHYIFSRSVHIVYFVSIVEFAVLRTLLSLCSSCLLRISVFMRYKTKTRSNVPFFAWAAVVLVALC